MSVIWFNSETPKSKFAPNMHIPLYKGEHVSQTLLSSLESQILEFEKQIQTEELVSEVPRSMVDPYPWTQHWKQHNLLFDAPSLGSEHLDRFAMTPELNTLFHIIRKHYLLFLRELNYPRVKVYVHAWANVLRDGQWISLHSHTSDSHSYLSGTYYLTTNDTTLDIIDPTRFDHIEKFKTTAGNLIMFPSYISHESTVYYGDDLRISIAFDLCSLASVESNPWRPHVLLDDPNTMEGFEMYLKDRTLTA